MYFFNKIIWITGASSGIGKALAIKLSKQQCKLILSSRNTASLELVKQACDHPEHIKIIPLVGPSSIILSLMSSGFNGQKFKFHGYIPIEKIDKEQHIKKMMLSVKEERETQIFIETPYRNEKLLKDLLAILDNKIRLCLAINLTSSKEKIISDTVENWKLRKKVDIDKQLCIFLIN